MKRSISRSRGRKAASRSSGSTSNAKGYALRLLGVRGRSERELRERLKRKGFDEDAVTEAVAAVKELGLVDDEALAKELVSYGACTKGLGTAGITALLRRRGIPEEIIGSSGIIDELDELDEYRCAEELAGRKARLYKDLPAEKARRRLYGVLKRRGHSSETIKRVLDGVMEDWRGA